MIRKIIGFVFLALFLVCQIFFVNKYQGNIQLLFQGVSFLFLGISLSQFIPDKNYEFLKPLKKLSKRTVVSFLSVVLACATALFGFVVLKSEKYIFISLLIIVEISIPFFVSFEGKKPQARELVLIAVLCALAVMGRGAFYMVPQFKPVVAMVIVCGICFGGETGFLIGVVTGFISNFMFGQWGGTPWQMFSFGLIGFLAGVVYQKGILKPTRLSLSIFGGLSTVVVYGGIMNMVSLLMWQPNPNAEMIISTYVLGLPFDLIHAVSTVFFLWVFARPLMEKIERVKTKFGI